MKWNPAPALWLNVMTSSFTSKSHSTVSVRGDVYKVFQVQPSQVSLWPYILWSIKNVLILGQHQCLPCNCCCGKPCDYSRHSFLLSRDTWDTPNKQKAKIQSTKSVIIEREYMLCDVTNTWKCTCFLSKQTFVFAEIQFDVSLSSLHFFIHFFSHWRR